MHPDGRVTAVGVGAGVDTHAPWSELVWSVAQFSAGGQRVEPFGDNGLAQTPGSWDIDSPADVAIDREGRIVVIGRARPAQRDMYYRPRWAIVRYLPEGQPDPAFGGDGLVITEFPDSVGAEAESVSVAPDGSYVVVGYRGYVGQRSQGIIVRYGESGEVLDMSAPGPFPDSYLTGGDVDKDGRVLAVGVMPRPDMDGAQGVLARYTPDLELDPEFGQGGVVTSRYGTDDIPLAVTLDAGLAPSAIGWARAQPTASGLVKRYDAGGAPDSSFGAAGIFDWNNAPRSSVFVDGEYSLDRALIAVGRTGPNTQPENEDEDTTRPAIVRLTSGGKLDHGFGHEGVVPAPFGRDGAGHATRGELRSIALTPSGDLVAGGNLVDDTGYNHFTVAKFKGGPPDFVAPRIRVRSIQGARRARRIVVVLRCDEDCRVQVGGQLRWGHQRRSALRPRRAVIPAERSTNLTLRARVRPERRRVRCLLRLRASDTPGNTRRTHVRRALRLKP